MLQTICYDRLQSRESCSCDKNISLLQMQDIRLFGMLPFLFHYQQICHVHSRDSWYFALGIYYKYFLLSSNQPDADFCCLYHLSVLCNLHVFIWFLVAVIQYFFFLFVIYSYIVCKLLRKKTYNFDYFLMFGYYTSEVQFWTAKLKNNLPFF